VSTNPALTITLGLWLDGHERPGAPDVAGEVQAGPAAMLDLLETRLGLAGPATLEPVRIARYRAALAEADDGTRFYHASFGADPQAVAETLLRWRDEWVDGGWNGDPRPDASARIRDLAAVEARFRLALVPGFSDRLRAVADVLGCRDHGIGVVRLVDPMDAWSPGWRRVLTRLPVAGPEPGAAPVAAPPEGSDLALLGRALLDGERVRFSGDGTVTVLQAASDHGAGRWVAGLLDRAPGAADSTTVITGARGPSLDRSLRARDLPVTGAAALSRWRPALQVLPLSLAQCWRPLDPFRLLEFLSLAQGPLDRRLAGELAGAVASEPGIGGGAWHEAIERASAVATEEGDGAAR
jgi:hypothetical protein